MIVEKSFHKLTPDQVREMRATHVPGKHGYGPKILAEKYGVSKLTAWRVITGQIYKETNA